LDFGAQVLIGVGLAFSVSPLVEAISTIAKEVDSTFWLTMKFGVVIALADSV